jgi:LysR family hydrogen peroxide-inducible transcriptional activator
MVTLRQLRYLDALAHARHFGRAAERCAVTQPALSMQIKELEQELGLSLVERSGTAVRLTVDGQEVARRAASILSEVGELSAYARQRQGILVGPFRLGMIPSVAPYLLPKLLQMARKRYPDLALLVRETQTASLLAELARGELDAVLLALPVDDPQFETLALLDDPFQIAVEAKAAESWSSEQDLQARLAREPLLLLEEGHCLRDQALQFCRVGNHPHRQALAATSLTTILHMVSAGQGVTLLPELCARTEVDQRRVALISFPGEAPRRTIGLAWRASAARQPEFAALGDLIRASA